MLDDQTLGALSAPDETTKQLAGPMADDPLEWHFATMPSIRRRVARAQHLSLTSSFLGPRKAFMRTMMGAADTTVGESAHVLRVAAIGLAGDAAGR